MLCAVESARASRYLDESSSLAGRRSVCCLVLAAKLSEVILEVTWGKPAQVLAAAGVQKLIRARIFATARRWRCQSLTMEL